MLTFAILAIIAILFIVDVIVFSYEEYEWSIGIMVATIVGAYFFTPYVKDFITASGGWTPIFTYWTPLYLGVGFATALVKWLLLSMKTIRGIREAKVKFDIENPVVEVVLTRAEQLKEKSEAEVKAEEALAKKAIFTRRSFFVEFYKKYIPYDSHARDHIYEVDFNSSTAIVDALTPRAKDNVGRITIWVFQWPIVIISTLFSDILLKLTRLAARILDLMFSWAARKLVANATKGL